MTTVTKQEQAQVDRANASGKTPVVFVHGLWLLPSSWDRWARLFDGAGFAAVSPGWPDDPDTVEEAKAHPDVFAKKSVGQVADYFDEAIRGLDKKPAVIGHSSRARGRRILETERPIADGPIRDIGEEEVLEFMMKELAPIVER